MRAFLGSDNNSRRRPGVRKEWRCHCPLPFHRALADPVRHKPSFAAHISGRMAGRWHCFACQTGGDAIAFVEAFAGGGFAGGGAPAPDQPGPLPRGRSPSPAPPTRHPAVVLGSLGASPPGRSEKRQACLYIRAGVCTRRRRHPALLQPGRHGCPGPAPPSRKSGRL